MSNNRRKDPSQIPASTMVVMWVILLGAAAGFLVWGAVSAAAFVDGTELPASGTQRVLGLMDGSVAWSPVATVILVLQVLVLAAVVVGIMVLVRRRKGEHTRVDHAASHMGVGRDIEPLTAKAVRASAERLGVADSYGVPIAVHLVSDQWLFGSWEDMHLDIWGPRTGKTTSRAIPACLAAPGAVLVTSNKRDIVDATRDPRSAFGEVWVFDPQGIADESPNDWYWDILSYVTDWSKALKLAEHFASNSREPGARTDAYFDPAGQDLLAGLLLAAALDGRPITDVYRWVTRPTEKEPVRILERFGSRYQLVADQVAGVIQAPDKQRGGIFGTAQQMAACLTNPDIVRWVCSDGIDDGRRKFDPHAFVRGRNTLYSLSKEEKGSAGPLVTALTVAVVEAAEELAIRSPGGRLQTPLVGVLDEAANVCRWRRLPDLYSHYGSRGIILMTILQSWSQGVDVWGESGMKKLFSAANVFVYGGGVREDGFLERLAKLIGEHDRLRTSTSQSKTGRSVSQQVQKERTFTVSMLSELPKGRCLVFASGARTTLARTVPWMRSEHAEAVKASIAAHDPAGIEIVDHAIAELEENEKLLELWEAAA